jgi:hypothetical protein
MDFFLWGYVMERDFREEVANLNELRVRVTNVRVSVTPQILENTWSET